MGNADFASLDREHFGGFFFAHENRLHLCLWVGFFVADHGPGSDSDGLGMDRSGAPGKIRTCDLKLRRLSLYPSELRARFYELTTHIRAAERISTHSPERRNRRASFESDLYRARCFGFPA